MFLQREAVPVSPSISTSSRKMIRQVALAAAAVAMKFPETRAGMAVAGAALQVLRALL